MSHKLACLLCEDHCALLKHVKGTIEQYTVRLSVIPPCPSTFLIKVLHGFAEGVMYNKADIRLINSHSKGYCSYHNLSK